jgi:poly(hydroxyalkanoate) granule-associated protein
MLKKAREQAKAGDGGDDAKDLARTVLDSSRQIWLAGLGAFSRAQAEGMKMFETLVEQGQSLESRTKRAASETAAAAAGVAAQKAKEMHAAAGGTWDKLEQVFEARVARALSKLGVYTHDDVARLAERVDALSDRVNELIKQSPRAPRTERPVGKSKRASRRPATRAAEAVAPGEAASASHAADRIPRKSAKRRAPKAG